MWRSRSRVRSPPRTRTAINRRLLPLHARLFVEANPIPVKWALQRMGRMQGGIRLPMTPLDPKYHAVLETALRESGVLA